MEFYKIRATLQVFFLSKCPDGVLKDPQLAGTARRSPQAILILSGSNFLEHSLNSTCKGKNQMPKRCKAKTKTHSRQSAVFQVREIVFTCISEKIRFVCINLIKIIK